MSLYDSIYTQQQTAGQQPPGARPMPPQGQGVPPNMGMNQGLPQGIPQQQYQQQPMQGYPSYPQQVQPMGMGGYPGQMGMPMQPVPMGWGMGAPMMFSSGLTPGSGSGSNSDSDYYRGFYEGVIRNSGPQIGSALSWIAPIAINLAFFLGPLWYVRRRYAQQMASIAGKTADGKGKKDSPMGSFMDMMSPMKPKNYRVEVKGTKFDDVIGIPEAKEELKQYVDFLSDPKKFTRLGARLPKGCLLTGKPGTGKTLIAKAIAGEAKTPFFTCSGADFIEIFGGSGPKRVRELFNEAKEAAPCVVFIDEIDAIGSRNGGRSMGGGSSEENRTINQLLAELDGLTTNQAIVVIAATNYPDAVDKALLREGRFDRKVNIPMPDSDARNELFTHYLNRVITGDPNCKPKIMKLKKKEDGAKPAQSNEEGPPPEMSVDETVPVVVVPGVDNKTYAKVLADRTPGVSPAQINTIVNEAALAAAVADEKVVTLKYLQDAIDDVLIGKKHRQRMSDKSLMRTAYHEVGHAIMSWTCPMQKDVIKISIIPRGRAGGYTQQVQSEALDPQTDAFLFSQLCVLLGGRCAEKIIMGDISTGAVDDLQRATKIAIDKLLHYGMSKEIGQIAFKAHEKQDGRAWMNWSEDLHSKVEAEAKAMVDRAYKHTLNHLTKNKDKLHQLSQLLLQKKELLQADIEGVLGPKAKKVEAAAAAAASTTTVKA